MKDASNCASKNPKLYSLSILLTILFFEALLSKKLKIIWKLAFYSACFSEGPRNTLNTTADIHQVLLSEFSFLAVISNEKCY
jgi:hypothetical protein